MFERAEQVMPSLEQEDKDQGLKRRQDEFTKKFEGTIAALSDNISALRFNSKASKKKIKGYIASRKNTYKTMDVMNSQLS